MKQIHLINFLINMTNQTNNLKKYTKILLSLRMCTKIEIIWKSIGKWKD